MNNHTDKEADGTRDIWFLDVSKAQQGILLGKLQRSMAVADCDCSCTLSCDCDCSCTLSCDCDCSCTLSCDCDCTCN